MLGAPFRWSVHGFPDVAPLGKHERLVEDIMSAANTVVFDTLADDILSKVFSGL